jgi:multidrug efflux pump subunit AcrA (membrane-fusion protein)
MDYKLKYLKYKKKYFDLIGKGRGSSQVLSQRMEAEVATTKYKEEQLARVKAQEQAQEQAQARAQAQEQAQVAKNQQILENDTKNKTDALQVYTNCETENTSKIYGMTTINTKLNCSNEIYARDLANKIHIIQSNPRATKADKQNLDKYRNELKEINFKIQMSSFIKEAKLDQETQMINNKLKPEFLVKNKKALDALKKLNNILNDYNPLLSNNPEYKTKFDDNYQVLIKEYNQIVDNN